MLLFSVSRRLFLSVCVAIYFIFLSASVSAATEVSLSRAPITAIEGFSLIQATQDSALIERRSATQDTLVQMGGAYLNPLTQQKMKRYQQYYRGVPVLGAEVILHESTDKASRARREVKSVVSGRLYRGIAIEASQIAQFNTSASLTHVLNCVEKVFLNDKQFQGHTIKILKSDAALALFHPDKDKHLRLVVKVNLTVRIDSQVRSRRWKLLVAATDPTKILRIDNGLRYFDDTGPGGNGLTQRYHYGENGLPPLSVEKEGDICTLANAKLQLNDLSDKTQTNLLGFIIRYNDPFQYLCGSSVRDVGGENLAINNGAYSPADDAFFFGQTVIDMYQDWLHQPALIDSRGQPERLVLQVHLRDPDTDDVYFDNAFWDSDSRTMNFGDGDEFDFYPLVSPDVIGHEVSHGFTEDHANLDYMMDYSGSLNESFSDMAGIAVQAYLLEKYPALYQAVYHSDQLVWEIGKTLSKSGDMSFREYPYPSHDHQSADCYDEAIANAHLLPDQLCQISYETLQQNADRLFHGYDLGSIMDRSSYVVHTASGIYNRFIYFLAQNPDWTLQKIFQLVATANMDYWVSETGYVQAMQGIVSAAQDLQMGEQRIDEIKQAALKVGITLPEQDVSSSS